MEPEQPQFADRREAGSGIRVPFVRRCSIAVEDDPERSAFTVNLNSFGVYLADPQMPRLGQPVVCRFRLPGSELWLELKGAVAWLNPRQAHRVHSLPPGFGVRFFPLPDATRAALDGIVREYLARRPRTRR